MSSYTDRLLVLTIDNLLHLASDAASRLPAASMWILAPYLIGYLAMGGLVMVLTSHFGSWQGETRWDGTRTKATPWYHMVDLFLWPITFYILAEAEWEQRELW